MRIFFFFFLLLSSLSFAQKQAKVDSLLVSDASAFFVDDYRNFYFYKGKDFSLVKVDSLGKQKGKMLLTVPYKIQNVQNSLSIPLFSENAQEVLFVDQNLNSINKLTFSDKFWFVKNVYVEDLQQIWILEESSKRLIQYNYKTNSVLNSYAVHFSFEGLKNMLVCNGMIYLLSDTLFEVFTLKGTSVFSKNVDKPLKLYRQNDTIFIISENQIFSFDAQKQLQTVFVRENSKFVDKNSTSYFELRDGKVYIYNL